MTDLSIVTTVQSVVTASPIVVAFAVFAARWLIFFFVPIGVLLLVSTRREDRHGVAEAAWSAALALVLTSLIAAFVGRLRPFVGFAEVSLLIPPPFNTSFPSGHTATAFAIAAAIAFANRRWGIIAFAIATLIALGRLAVGVHYPTDLLGGFVLGSGCFLLVRYLHRQIRTTDIERSARHHKHS